MLPKIRQLRLFRDSAQLSFISALVLAFSVTAVAGDFCGELFFGPQADETQIGQARDVKPELMMVGSALREHVRPNPDQQVVTQLAVKSFVENIDPLKLVFLESEHEVLTHLSENVNKQIQIETFQSANRTFFSDLTEKALNRYENLINKFFRSGAFRRRILKTAKDLSKDLQNDHKSQEKISRPKTEAEVEERLVQLLAKNIVNLQKMVKEMNRELSEVDALKLVVRSLEDLNASIRMALHPMNLPIFISKAFIDAFDPHSRLSLGAQANATLNGMKGSFGGVGVLFSFDPQGLIVKGVVENGPSAKVGLLNGDIITHMSTPEMREHLPKLAMRKKHWFALKGIWPMSETVSSYFRGLEGTEVQVRVLRDGKPIEFKLTREIIKTGSLGIKVEKITTSKGTVAHVKLNRFFTGSTEQLRDQIIKIKSTEKLSGMVLDLRQNGGGDMNDLVGILGLFVKSGPGVSLLSSKRREEMPIPANSEQVWEGPLVVMTDTGSASASEGLSGALQDYGRAIIVGDTQTFGKGTMQDVSSMGEGAMIALTTAMFFTPSGHTPQVTGVISDIVLSEIVEGKHRFEKDYEHVIPPTKIQGTLPEGFSLIPNKAEVIAQLKTRSAQRLSSLPKAKDNKEVFEQNTQEAHKILEDLIAILQPKP